MSEEMWEYLNQQAVQRHNAEKDESSSAPALLPCGFNPMATAPKDGTKIEILFFKLCLSEEKYYERTVNR